MFVIDRDKNQMSEIPGHTLKALKIKEREHLQEWLANTPGALGEELLIVQKEFAGFEDTRHRLDLLALDKSGSLVIIENKRDDSGRDVVAQALKYVAYCSSLKKSQIVEIFQGYLKKQKRADESASALICDFLEKDSIEEVSLNSGSGQRFILVAANFGKEVTSTAMWLISNGIRAQCIKVTPYSFKGNILLDINQLIPPPEAKDYMIEMSSKGSEENKTTTIVREHQQLRLQFWEKTLEYFRARGLKLYSNVSPSKSHWLNTGAGGRGCIYTMIFGKSIARVDFVIKGSDKNQNQKIFSILRHRKKGIEERFGNQLEWIQPDDKTVGRIQYSQNFDGYNKDNWEDIIVWLFENIQNLDKAFKPLVKEIP